MWHIFHLQRQKEISLKILIKELINTDNVETFKMEVFPLLCAYQISIYLSIYLSIYPSIYIMLYI